MYIASPSRSTISGFKLGKCGGMYTTRLTIASKAFLTNHTAAQSSSSLHYLKHPSPSQILAPHQTPSIFLKSRGPSRCIKSTKAHVHTSLDMRSHTGTIHLVPLGLTKSRRTLTARTPDGAYRLTRPNLPALTVDNEPDDDEYFANINEEIMKANVREDARSVRSKSDARSVKSTKSHKSNKSVKTTKSAKTKAERYTEADPLTGKQLFVYKEQKKAAREKFLDELLETNRGAFLNKKNFEDDMQSMVSEILARSHMMEEMWGSFPKGKLFPPPELETESTYYRRGSRVSRGSPLRDGFVPLAPGWQQEFLGKCTQIMRDVQDTQRRLQHEMAKLEAEKRDLAVRQKAILAAYATAKMQLKLQDKFTRELEKLQELRKAAEDERLQRYGANFWGWPGITGPAGAQGGGGGGGGLTQKQEKSPKAKIEDKKPDKKQEPKQKASLKIYDYLDPKQMPFVFPYDVCKTWASFLEALKAAFQGLELQIDKGQIQLYNKTSNVRILPAHWEKTVEPGLEVLVDFLSKKAIGPGSKKTKIVRPEIDDEPFRQTPRFSDAVAFDEPRYAPPPHANRARGFLRWATEADKRREADYGLGRGPSQSLGRGFFGGRSHSPAPPPAGPGGGAGLSRGGSRATKDPLGSAEAEAEALGDPDL